MPKNAATTKEERDSFDSWVNGGKVSDAFRRLHPDAEGAYTYWSVRTGAVSHVRNILRPRLSLLVVVVVRVRFNFCCCRLMGPFVVLCKVRSRSSLLMLRESFILLLHTSMTTGESCLLRGICLSTPATRRSHKSQSRPHALLV